MESQTAAPTKTVDIVIPAYNEEANIARVIETVFESLVSLPYRFELIIVDDGSHDRTAEIAASYVGRYPLRVVRLTRNFGKENALLAGLDLARGAATILMDADLQHPVELIPEFLVPLGAGLRGRLRGEAESARRRLSEAPRDARRSMRA